ncbi:hypothetical protein KC957_01360 [Candidatus Saccharibacteria bacterium]|nr:hypothetical protein [Candidatus Saccharibacteria bacterium]
MSMPPIEIRWGGGRWPRQRRRVAFPTVRTALDLAGYGVEALGVECREPKTAVIWCAGESFADEGGAEVGSQTEFELYLRTRALKHRTIARWLPTITTSAVHEVLHCAREEHGLDTASLEGRIADEGIANFGEFLVAQSLLTRQEFREEYPHATFTPGSSSVQALRESLRHDMRALVTLPSESRDHHAVELEDAWLTPATPKALAAGETLGVGAVAELLVMGHDFADIIQMPPWQVLGLE